MHDYTFLLEIVLVLVSARILGEMAAYFKVPSVIGELFAGILLGPSLLGWVSISTPIQLLAQVGVILLLFEVGLETSIAKLFSSGPKASGLAIAGVLIPFILGFVSCHSLLQLPFMVSLFIGSILTATSIGVTLRILHSLKRQEGKELPIIIGAAVIDDILGIILLSTLYEFTKSGQIDFLKIGKISLMILFFLFLSPFCARLIASFLRKWHERSDIPGLLPTMILSFILIFSWIANLMGAPELLGGLSVGLALSRQFFLPFGAFLKKDSTFAFSQRVEREMRPIIAIFTPIFFVSIGLMLNLQEIHWGHSSIWTITSLLFIVAVIGKLAAGFTLYRETYLTKLIMGTAMVPRGEVGLIFAKIGLLAGILQNEMYASIILMIILTTIAAPFALRYLYALKTSQKH